MSQLILQIQGYSFISLGRVEIRKLLSMLYARAGMSFLTGSMCLRMIGFLDSLVILKQSHR